VARALRFYVTATKACGKSTLLGDDATQWRIGAFIVSKRQYRRLIFRAIEAWKPDAAVWMKADTWMKQNEELASRPLNSGPTRRRTPA